MSESSHAGFDDLGLYHGLTRQVHALGFTAPTPIQAAAIPVMLSGRDMIGRARTGSGKTAAFALPLLNRLRDGGDATRALILAPTRELAIQVSGVIQQLAGDLPLDVATIYGGVAYPPQFRALRQATVVVGTPGRVRDHLERGTLDLSNLEIFVMDEADRMLQMGFIEDIQRLLSAAPAERQVVMFSASMPSAIRTIATSALRDPLTVSVEDKPLSVAHIAQQWTLVPRQHQLEALATVLDAFDAETALVFTQTKAAAAEVGEQLAAQGRAAASLHGDMSQAKRERVVQAVRRREIAVLVATDVAARGLDIDHITHVINLEPPRSTESYVHRIGRTGRAGRPGLALTFTNSKGKRRLHSLSDALEHPIEAVDLPIPDGATRPVWSRSAEAFGRPPPTRAANVNEVTLWCSIGRRHRARAADLVGLLTKEGGIPGRAIGLVQIFEWHTLIGVPREVADQVLKHFSTARIRDQDIRFELAKKPAPTPPQQADAP